MDVVLGVIGIVIVEDMRNVLDILDWGQLATNVM